MAAVILKDICRHRVVEVLFGLNWCSTHGLERGCLAVLAKCIFKELKAVFNGFC